MINAPEEIKTKSNSNARIDLVCEEKNANRRFRVHSPVYMVKVDGVLSTADAFSGFYPDRASYIDGRYVCFALDITLPLVDTKQV